jgi:hypothetical protein
MKKTTKTAHYEKKEPVKHKEVTKETKEAPAAVNRIPEIMMNIHRGNSLTKYPDLSASEKKDLLVALDNESQSEKIDKYPEREKMRQFIRKQLEG